MTGENNGHGHTITINHILVALILLVFIVFFEDFKSMVFLDRHPHQESGYKLQDKPGKSAVSPALPLLVQDLKAAFPSSSFVDTSSSSHTTAQDSPITDRTSSSVLKSYATVSPPTSSSLTSFSSKSAQHCNDPVWCNIEMPKRSHFNFDPPTDIKRWKMAQIRASNGEQVFLKKLSKIFTHPFDFLDGDRSFRKLHHGVDVFMDERIWLSSLSKSGKMKAKPSSELHAWETTKEEVIPKPYDWEKTNRAPIVQVGYIAFKKDRNQFFSGNFKAGAFTSREKFISEWNAVKNEVETPIIVECALNENWGWISTAYPNRTAAWGQCCIRPQEKYVLDFLEDPKILAVITGQHHNVSHPKVLTIPRGLPIQWQHTEKLIFDSIHTNQVLKKDRLLFASASSWGPRPQILKCVSSKFTVEDFEGHVDTHKDTMAQTKTDRPRYYKKLASAKFGLALPGLGYDCFRTWELLTMGTLVVTERGYGFDRTFWRLPVLLVEDFMDITPDLLKTAYVEAVYRADDFEFERLKQSFWWSVIMNVSLTRSIQPLLDKFPMEAEDPTFTRPRVPFECPSGGCGPGTKRIPKNSC